MKKDKNKKRFIPKINYFCPKCKSKNVWIADNSLTVTMEGSSADGFKDNGKCLNCGFSSLSKGDFTKGGLKRRIAWEKEERLKGDKEWKKIPKILPIPLTLAGIIFLVLSFYYAKTNQGLYWIFSMGGFCLLLAGFLFYLGIRAHRK